MSFSESRNAELLSLRQQFEQQSENSLSQQARIEELLQQCEEERKLNMQLERIHADNASSQQALIEELLTHKRNLLEQLSGMQEHQQILQAEVTSKDTAMLHQTQRIEFLEREISNFQHEAEKYCQQPHIFHASDEPTQRSSSHDSFPSALTAKTASVSESLPLQDRSSLICATPTAPRALSAPQAGNERDHEHEHVDIGDANAKLAPATESKAADHAKASKVAALVEKYKRLNLAFSALQTSARQREHDLESEIIDLRSNLEAERAQVLVCV